MANQEEYISEFLDEQTIHAVPDFLAKEDFSSSADVIAAAFGAQKEFSKMDENSVSKLVKSFKNNLTLLIQKTWVEKSDIALKEQLLYQMEQFLGENASWKENYALFLQLINQAVFLMFGQKPDSPDFAEYTLRIDPEFGIFWWYISSLPPKNDWSEDKCRIAMMLGMYFLANY